MRCLLRHRQPAQLAPLALMAMVVLVGAVALVVDAGVFFVTQRQLQNAADAAALAAVWYPPVCNYPDDPDCQKTSSSPCDADCMGDAVVQANMGFAGKLCGNLQISPPPKNRTVTAESLTYYVITIDCDAPYWFARVFPEIPAVMHLRGSATATIGYPTLTGVFQGPPLQSTDHLIARLCCPGPGRY